jgi:acyl-CoA synthetase (AMP-forming)/AMP-acid ligase II
MNVHRNVSSGLGLDSGGPLPGAGFAATLEQHGTRTALITEDGTQISYAALAAMADAAPLPPNRCLVALGIRPVPEDIALYLGALRRGYPILLLADTDSAASQAIISRYGTWVPGDPEPANPPALHPDLAVLLSTSGSTGSPKLIRLSATNIASNAASIASYLAIVQADRAITSLPLHYSYGLSVLNSHLAVGAATILTDASVADASFWALFEREGATHMAGVPYSYELLERTGFRNRILPSLRTLTQAGGRLPQALVETYAEWAAERNLRFYVMYGQTEATARIAWLPPELATTHSDCIGIPIPGGTLTLEDEAGRDAGDGPGQLVYRGPNVMMGYATGPEDLARGPELAALHTGDLATRTPSGLFRIVSRMNRFSKLFGLRIGHDEVERQLQAEGLDALATGDDAALVVLVAGAVPADLAATLAARYGLPASAVQVEAVEALPRLPSGKPDYGAARQIAVQRRPPAAGIRPGSVAAVFAQAFPRVAVQPTDSFASLGGDSLNYVTFALMLEDVIGDLPADWPELSLATLAARETNGVRKRLRWLESDVVVRAAAISSVVLVHTGIGIPDELAPAGWLSGGALALMILFGFNLSRFQQQRLLSGQGLRVAGDFFGRVILPYLGLLYAYGLYKQKMDWPSLLLVSNWFGRFGTMLEPYWFLEAAGQMMLAVVALFALPAVRAHAAARPLRFAGALLVGALAIKAAGALLLDQAVLKQRTLDANLVWLAIGWAAALPLVRWQQAGLVLLGGALAVLDWGAHSTRVPWTVIALAVILFVPRLPLPRLLAWPVATVARASFTIYLTHLIVINLMELRLHVVAPWTTLALALALGVSVWTVQEALIGRYRSRAHQP